MQPTYVAYYRVSTQMQGQSGLGLEAQRHAVAAFTNGNVIAEFTEIESGKNNNRPELKRALEQARAANAILVIAKLDRLSRNVHFISGLLEQRVPIKACDMPNADNFQFHIMAALAEKERDMISERTKAAIAAKQARGEAWGTRTAATVQAKSFAARMKPIIAELGFTSPHTIAHQLNLMGIATERGGRWQTVQVQRLIEKMTKC